MVEPGDRDFAGRVAASFGCHGEVEKHVAVMQASMIRIRQR